MDVNALGTAQAMQAFGYTQTSCGIQPGEEPFQGGPCGVGSDISLAGKLMGMISEMSEEDKAEMLAFHQEMHQAIESGTFDAAEMAEEAPEALKAFAEENGIDLEEMLTTMAEGGRPHGGPPPIGLYNSSGIGISDSDEDQTTDLISMLFADEDSENDTLLTSLIGA
jgi:hypothetical protein